MKALEELRVLQGPEWKERREQVVDDVVRLAAGVDSKKGARLGDQVSALLSRAHSLSAEEFKAKRAELEKEARQLVGDLSPLEVMPQRGGVGIGGVAVESAATGGGNGARLKGTD